MIDPDPFDPEDFREMHWPLLARDPDLTISAAGTIGELVRYLNHATRSAPAVPDAATLYRLTGNLASAAHGLNQLCDQLAGQAAAIARDPAVRHAEDRQASAETSHRAAIVSLAAAASGLSDSAALAHQLGNRLALVQGLLTWISHDGT